MKLIILFCLVLLVSFSEQRNKYVNCPKGVFPLPDNESSCNNVICDGPDRSSGTTCAESRCPPEKKEEIIKGDMTKIYPECCDRVTCS